MVITGKQKSIFDLNNINQLYEPYKINLKDRPYFYLNLISCLPETPFVNSKGKYMYSGVQKSKICLFT